MTDYDIHVGGANGFVPMAMATPVTDPYNGKSNEPEVSLLQTNQSPSMVAGASSASGIFIPMGPVAPLQRSQIDQLLDQGFTMGMIQCLERSKRETALRIWIIDNSGSMQMNDGYQLVPMNSAQSQGGFRQIPSSRWDELRDCIRCHIHLANALRAPTHFRFLNDPGVSVGPQIFGIAENTDGQSKIDRGDEVQVALEVIRKERPHGVTPLAEHIDAIYAVVLEAAPRLRASGQKVAIMIATDGMPSDEEGRAGEYAKNQFLASLRQLEGMPVWITIRLCTDEDNVVEFYNELDGELELSIEVLDDYLSEASEIRKCNQFLNYALPIHRLREMGCSGTERLLDLLDERKLSRKDIGEFVRLLFGDDDGLPDPNIDYKLFCEYIKRHILPKHQSYWHPLKRKMKPLISVNSLTASDGDDGCFIM